LEQFTTFGESGYAVDGLQLFQGIAQADVAVLLARCPVARVAAGQALQGDDSGPRLYIVLRGALDVTRADVRPESPEAAARVLPGECVGELSVLDEEASADSICARQDSDLLVIDAATLWRLIDESNGVARNLLRLLSFRIRAANAQLRRRQKVGEFYRKMSMADGLTGLHNRTWLNENLAALIDGAHASGQPLSLIMIDIDHFKQFNDEHGHQCGDSALRIAADAIAGALRPTDFAARYGGEELIVILPATGRAAATVVAQRLCEQVRNAIVFADMRRPLPHVTASFGVATLEEEQDAEALISIADAALYRAKEAGRDRIAV
jgi:diguanylate cyclase (GGDEF)-like protein